LFKLSKMKLIFGLLIGSAMIAVIACGAETITVVETVIVEKEVKGDTVVETVIVTEKGDTVTVIATATPRAADSDAPVKAGGNLVVGLNLIPPPNISS